MAMKAYPSSFLTIFAAVVLVLHQVYAENDGDQETMSVTIYNEVPVRLEVHCYSKDDLNVHYLLSRTSYSFTFKSSFWGSTLYWCTFSYTNGVRWNSFEVWTDNGLWRKKKRPCNLVCLDCADGRLLSRSERVPPHRHASMEDGQGTMNPMEKMSLEVAESMEFCVPGSEDKKL